jgi:hypothetical protein
VSTSGTGRRSRTSRAVLWPWGPAWAAVAVPAVLAVGLVTYGVVRAIADWPSDRYQGWILLGITLLAVLPLGLLILQALISMGGTLKIPGGVEFSFASASTAAASTVRSTTLSENLDSGPSPADPSSGLRSILRSLQDARGNDVTIVNLRDGQAWWESRLFVLVAGASRRAQPRAIAFVGDRNGRQRVFLGWARPADLLATHLAKNACFKAAERAAASRAAIWQLGTPDPAVPSTRVTLPWPALAQPAPGTQPASPATCDLPQTFGDFADPRFAYELFLQSELESRTPEAEQAHVTPSGVEALYEKVLVVDQVDASADEDSWIALLRSTPREFFAMTAHGTLRTLVPRDALVSALIATLAARMDRG